MSLTDLMCVQIVSEAAMRLPEEVYRADGKGALKAEGELTHEERRRRRAQHKRAFKGKTQQQVRFCRLVPREEPLSQNQMMICAPHKVDVPQ